MWLTLETHHHGHSNAVVLVGRHDAPRDRGAVHDAAEHVHEDATNAAVLCHDPEGLLHLCGCGEVWGNLLT